MDGWLAGWLVSWSWSGARAELGKMDTSYENLLQLRMTIGNYQRWSLFFSDRENVVKVKTLVNCFIVLEIDIG